MPKYTIKSGDMTAEIETAHDADPMILTVMALLQEEPMSLGFIASVSNPHDENDESYVYVPKALMKMGRMAKDEMTANAMEAK